MPAHTKLATFPNLSRILYPYLFFLDGLIAHQLIPVQILPVHIDAGDLMVIIGRVIVNSLIRITAGGINGDLAFTILQLTATALLIY